MKENYKKLAQEWFDKANNDLLFAKAGWKETNISSIACFLSQQVVEKYLKGFLTSKAIEPERTHNLTKLLKKCIKVDRDFEKFTKQCEVINKYYIESRYPLDIPQNYSKKQVREAFEIAENIIFFIKKKNNEIK